MNFKFQEGNDASSCNMQLQQVVNRTENSDIKANRMKISIKPFTQLAKEGKDLPELKKVWGNYILERNTVLFPSERGVGKTYLALQIAMAVAGNGDCFLGEEMACHGNTLYINFELSEYIMKKRLSKLWRGLKQEESPYQAIAVTAMGSLTDLLPLLKKEVRKSKPVLVVIDNLRMAFSDRDNERNKEMVIAIKQLNQLRDEYNSAYLLIHHTKKGTSYQKTNSDLQSGAGAITDLVDGDFFLRKSQQDHLLRVLKREKSRNCEEQAKPKLLRLNPATLWFEVENEEVNEADHIYYPTSGKEKKEAEISGAREMKTKGMTCKEIGQELGVDKSTISRWLNEK